MEVYELPDSQFVNVKNALYYCSINQKEMENILTLSEQKDAKRLGITLTLENNELNDALRYDAVMMQDLLNGIDRLNCGFDSESFDVISSAFKMKIEAEPEKAKETFEVFSKLQSVIRIITKHDNFICEKILDYEAIDRICDKLEIQRFQENTQSA